MAVETLWCLLRQTVVDRVVEEDGRVTAVLCPEYNGRADSCQLKSGVLDDEALSQLVEHVPDHPLEHSAARCLLR